MHCKACGIELPEDASFCPKCGSATTAAGSGKEESAVNRGKLSPGRKDEPEEQLWEGSYCYKAMIGYWILCAVVTVLVLAVGIWLSLSGSISTGGWGGLLSGIAALWIAAALYLLYRKISIRYTLSTQRLIHRAGILSRRTDRIEVIDMDDVAVQQNLIERLVGVGKVRITSSDRTHPELVLLGIEDAEAVAEKIDNARRHERIRRGLHIESI